MLHLLLESSDKHSTSNVIIGDGLFIDLGRFSNNNKTRISLGKNSLFNFNGYISI